MLGHSRLLGKGCCTEQYRKEYSCYQSLIEYQQQITTVVYMNLTTATPKLLCVCCMFRSLHMQYTICRSTMMSPFSSDHRDSVQTRNGEQASQPVSVMAMIFYYMYTWYVFSDPLLTCSCRLVSDIDLALEECLQW